MAFWLDNKVVVATTVATVVLIQFLFLPLRVRRPQIHRLPLRQLHLLLLNLRVYLCNLALSLLSNRLVRLSSPRLLRLLRVRLQLQPRLPSRILPRLLLALAQLPLAVNLPLPFSSRRLYLTPS
jgi:hypothetical protein